MNPDIYLTLRLTWSSFCEFPAPGDAKKHLLPIYYDAEEEEARLGQDANSKEKSRDYWMPV